MKKIIFCIFLLGFTFTQDAFLGYLKTTEASFCMDDCSQYYLEPESSDSPEWFDVINVVFNDTINLEMYLNRFVEVIVSNQEINCVECSAFEVLEINLSNDCELPVACLVDPCTVGPPCELNTPVDCMSNYCGGCNADFYDLDGNLVDCYGDDDPGPNPCSDFDNPEECEWFDECVWTDNGCQDANWEDGCGGLSQDECESLDYCEWISDSDNPNNWGMCIEVDNEDGPPECLMDCEGIEYVDPQEDPYEACDWIISTFGLDPGFGSCFNDCDEDTIMLIYSLVEGCYNCLGDTTLDCADVFDDEDNNDWECSDLSQDECYINEGCQWNEEEGMCVEHDWGGGECEEGLVTCPDGSCAEHFSDCFTNDECGDGECQGWENGWNCPEDCDSDINNCSDLGEDECETVVFCDWNEEEGMCVEYDWGGGECEDLNYAECLVTDDCEWISDSDNPNNWGMCVEANDDWECSDFDSEEECQIHDCEWELNASGTGQCIEGDGFEPICEDLSDYLFGPCDMIIGIGWNGQECTWYSGCGTIDEDGVDHSDSFFDSIEECEAACSDNQQGDGVLYGTVEYIWGDAIELVVGALIEIQEVTGFSLYTTQTNEEGFYEIELPQGPYIVTVHAYDEYQVHDIYIIANHEHELNFTLGEFYYETALVGNVSCGDCPNDYAPISDAHIVISNPNQWFNMETFTDEDGFFWASLPASGMYNVSISADNYMDFDDYIYVQGITEMNFYLDTDSTGGDGYAILSLEDVTASAGSEVSIPLFLESDLEVAGVQFSVNYSSATGSYIYPSGLNSTDSCFIAEFNEVNGEFIGIIFSLEGCVVENVHIADLVFEVADNVPSGFEAYLTFNSTLVADIDGNEILSYGEGCNILFGSLGDVNSDGDLNILDIVLIVNFAIYIEEPTDSQFWAADINQDDLINILDIVQVVNMILDN